MNKKKKIIFFIAVILLCGLNVFVFTHKTPVGGNYELHLSLTGQKKQEIQVYYSPTEVVNEEMSQTLIYDKENDVQEMIFSIPYNSKWIRLDLGKEKDKLIITDLHLEYGKVNGEINEIGDLSAAEKQQIKSLKQENEEIKIETSGTDPYIMLSLNTDNLYKELEKDCQNKNLILNLLMLLFIDGGALIAFVFRKKIWTLPIELYQNRELLWNLAKNDFKTKYAGSYLGIIWAFVQPIVTILVYWFVFSVGLKAGNVSDYPFVLYLVTGIIPWFFFQDALNAGTNALIEYNYLVKKVVFKISILPIVKVISALFVHVFFVVFSLVLCWAYGYGPSIYTLQIIYYSACTFLLVLGLVYATSAIVIFFRDLTQIISIFLQVGVWLTPIMWDLNMLANHPLMLKAFKLNPMYYIVSGYRESMLGHVAFTAHWGWTLYFWVVTVLLFGIGTVIFKRLKTHFADVL